MRCMSRFGKSLLLTVVTAAAQEPPRPFVSVFSAHGEVHIAGHGPAHRARISGCGTQASWTGPDGKFSVSGRSTAGSYLSCSLTIEMPGCDGRVVPMTAPAGSVDLGVIVLQPEFRGQTAGMVSFLSMSSPPDAQKLKKRAMERARRSEWRSAQQLLEAALNKYDADPEAWHGLGVARRNLGDAAGARTALERAAALDTRYAPPLRELALLALQAKDWSAAAELSRRALEINPAAMLPARLYRATSLLNLGDYSGAETEARAALGTDLAARAHHLLGVAIAKQGRLAEAVSELEESLRLAPSAPETTTVQQQLELLRRQNAR